MNFFTNKLSKPDSRTVADSKVPIRAHRNRRVVVNTCYLTFLIQLVNLAAIIATLLALVEVAVVFLLYHIFGHPFSTLRLYLLLCEYPSVSYRENLEKPLVWVLPGDFGKIPSMILPSRRVDKCTPPSVRSKNRFHEVIGHWIDEAALAENYPPWIRSHDSVVRAGPNKLNQRLSVAPIDPNLPLCVIWVRIDDLFGDIVDHALAVIRYSVPDDALGLCEAGQEVVVCPRLPVCPLDHVVPHRLVFPPPSVHDPTRVTNPTVECV